MFTSDPVHRVMPESYGAALAAVVQSYVYMAAIVRTTASAGSRVCRRPPDPGGMRWTNARYDEWLRGLIEQGRATPSPIDAAKPYVDAGDLDEFDDEDLEDEDEDEDEESYKKGQKGAPPPGLSPTTSSS